MFLIARVRVAIVRLGVGVGVIEHRAEAAPDRARHLEFEALVAPAVAVAAAVDLIGAIEQVRIGAACRDAARGLRPRHEDARQDFGRGRVDDVRLDRSEEHTSELKSLMRISYAVLCSKKKTT